MRKLAKTGNYKTGLAIIALVMAMAMAVAIMAGFAGMAGASESPKTKQPMLKLDIAEGIKLAQGCGVSAFYTGLIQAFQTDASGDAGGNASSAGCASNASTGEAGGKPL